MVKPEPRRVSRVLILDPFDRVLLLRFRLRDGRDIWIPPGGGVEPGEASAAAALREVQEETGVTLTRPLHLVWLRSAHYFQRDVAEAYFLARVTATPPVAAHAEPGAPAELLEHRWWGVSEIAAAEADTEFTPRHLGERLIPLIAGTIPAEPVEFSD